MTDLNALASAVADSAEYYRQCIVAACCCMSSEDYARNNGRAEATRQTCTRFAEAAGLAVPDWNAIKDAVPADGVCRRAS
jgi:hypothetical protein